MSLDFHCQFCILIVTLISASTHGAKLAAPMVLRSEYMTDVCFVEVNNVDGTLRYLAPIISTKKPVITSARTIGSVTMSWLTKLKGKMLELEMHTNESMGLVIEHLEQVSDTSAVAEKHELQCQCPEVSCSESDENSHTLQARPVLI